MSPLFLNLILFVRSDILYYLIIFVDISVGLEAGARTLGGWWLAAIMEVVTSNTLVQGSEVHMYRAVHYSNTEKCITVQHCSEQ